MTAFLRRQPAHPPHTAGSLAEHLDLIGREVVSGCSLSAALTLHGDPRRPAAPSVHHDGHRVAELAVARHAIDLAERLGGPQAACLHHAATVLREREAVAQEAQAHAAAAWASARLLTVVPAAFVAWGLVTSSSMRSALATPTGSACALAGALLNASGWRWMRSIVTAVTR